VTRGRRRERRVRKVLTVGFCVGIAAAAGSLCAAPQSDSARGIGSGRIRIDAAPVPLNPSNAAEGAIGGFRYAGGLALTSRETDQLHGLSDLDVSTTDRLTAVGDLGVMLDAQLLLDDAGRLVGITDARLTPLTGEDGQPLVDKAEGDAEGFAQLQDGDRLVSFERHHRILRYPANGGRPQPAPSPDVSFPPNGGMEALAPDPDSGADAYVVGAETTGDTWNCRLAPGCVKGPSVAKPEEFGLVAIAPLSGKRIAYLLRAFDAARGNRITLQILLGTESVGRMDLARPMTIDNFEGLAARRRSDGTIRFYLMSDDNGSATQRTLLLAFDWQPS
jgi:hypothetical protein